MNPTDNHNQKAAISILIIWFVLVAFVALAAYFTSVSSFVVLIMKEHELIHMAICLPGVIVLIIWALVTVLALARRDYDLKVRPVMLYVLIAYLTYVIALTGGIVASPLTSVSVLVPLLAGPFIRDTSRAHLLVALLASMLIIGLLSGTVEEFLLPPKSYPSGPGWRFAGHADWVITTLGICGSLAIEALLIKFKLKP
jgi:hypothetical protein